MVFLGMRPMHRRGGARRASNFGAGQIVASMVAGFSLDEIRPSLAEPMVCRFIPLPGIARGIGPIATYPAVPEIIGLFSALGDLFVVSEESKLHFGGLNSFMSSYYELQRALIDAGIAGGLSPSEARRYVVSLLGMLSDTAQRTPDDQFGALVDEHQTKGGLNERVRAKLLEWAGSMSPRRSSRKPPRSATELG